MRPAYISKFLIIILAVLTVLNTGCTSDKSKSKTSEGKGPTAGQGEQKQPSPGMYRVVRVVDGDTIVISYKSKNEKLRLIGINTPETKHPEKGTEPYGFEASEYTKKLLEKREVKVTFDVQQRDKYGRLLGYVYLTDGTFVNARLLSEGYAQVMTVPPNVKYAEEFVRLERAARKEEKGLWGIFYYNMDGNLEAE